MRRSVLLTICMLAAMLSTGAAFAQKKGGGTDLSTEANNVNAASGANQKGAPKGPGPKSPAEAQAVNAVIQAQMPDDVIKAVDALMTKFADTAYKSFALELEAEAYQNKKDNVKAIVYGEQSLQADPKNYDADNFLANITAATTRDTDLDKEEKLARAEKYAQTALDLLKTAPKPVLFGAMSDENWAKKKGEAVGFAWQALGTAALVRKKTDEAVADFQKGVDADPNPILLIRTGRALLAANKPDEAITWFEKAMNSPTASDQIKGIAQADRVRAVQAKGAAAPK